MPKWPISDNKIRCQILGEILSFVKSQLEESPFHVRIGIMILGISFHILVNLWEAPLKLFGSGRANREQSHKKITQLFNPYEQYLHLIQSLVILAYMENPKVLDALKVESGENHQLRYRNIRKKITDHVA